MTSQLLPLFLPRGRRNSSSRARPIVAEAEAGWGLKATECGSGATTNSSMAVIRGDAVSRAGSYIGAGGVRRPALLAETT